MAIKIAFDTNAYRAISEGDLDFSSLLKKADAIMLPVIVLGEIRSGIMLGSKKDRNTLQLADFLASPRVQLFNVDEDTAVHYASLFVQLRRQGRPIPTNDIWIAALCLQHGFVLATRDTDFNYVEALQTIGLNQ